MSLKDATDVFSTKGKDNWVKLAKLYDELERASESTTALLLKSADEYWPFSKATGILDNGMGPASVTNQLFQTYGSQIPADTKILGFDKAGSMVNEARSRRAAGIANGNKLWERVDLREVDALQLKDVPDGSLSHVLGGFFYFMLTDRQAALEESARVLCPGGVLSTSIMVRNDWVDMGSMLGEVRPQNKFDFNHGWKSTEVVERDLKAAGLRDVHAVDVEIKWPYKTHEGLVSFLMDNFPLYLVFRRDCTDEEWERLRKLTLDFMKKRSPEAPGELKGDAIVAVGRK